MELQSIWQQYELEQLEEGIHNLFPGSSFSLDNLLEAVWAGDILGAAKQLLSGSFGDITSVFGGMKNLFVWMLILGILSALMSHFIEVFDRHQVADLCFYFIYLLMMTILFKGFFQVAQIAVDTMENILLFNKLLIPTYMIVVGMATGTSTAGAYSQLLILIMYGVEQILLKWVIPMIYSYCMLSAINGIWIEEKLSLLMELLEKIVGWVLKAAIGVVTGVSIFQSVITPVIDSVKTSAFQKVITMIPGAGNVADGVLELVAGSAVVIKNSVGVLLLLLLVVMCAMPLLQIFLMALLFKGAAALLGIVADKRITAFVNHAGDAGMMLFRTTACVMLLFLIAIAVVAATTGRMGAAL